MVFDLVFRQAYRLAGGFNNFHGRLATIFYLLSDDKVGSGPRLAPGSKAKPDSDMEVTEEDEVAVLPEKDGSSRHTPLVGVQHPVKRKAGEIFSGSASKIKPT
jgi:hypothetical protein